MKSFPAICRVPEASGTPGTRPRDTRIRIVPLLLGLVLAACSGETESGSGDSTDNTANTTASDGATSNGTTSSGSSSGGNTSGGSTSGGTTSTTGAPNCSVGNPIDPACFGSPGPVTGGSTASVGAGGSTSGSSHTTTGSVGGSGGLGGEGGSAGATCEPQDVSGVGYCDAAFGVFFLGERCGWVSGCSCVGSDCKNGYEDEAACEAAHRHCLATE